MDMDIVKVGSALFRLDTVRIANALKTRWRDRTIPEGTRDDAARFNRLYLVPDPWSLNGEGEGLRFGQTNRLIQEKFGHPHSLLEIGCGEGLQSNELQQVCNRLYGIDISRRAIKRAKLWCPKATFVVGDMLGPSDYFPVKRLTS